MIHGSDLNGCVSSADVRRRTAQSLVQASDVVAAVCQVASAASHVASEGKATDVDVTAGVCLVASPRQGLRLFY